MLTKYLNISGPTRLICQDQVGCFFDLFARFDILSECAPFEELAGQIKRGALMEQPEFIYKRKPAFISFLLVYLFCFGIAYVLIHGSQAVSGVVTEQVLERLGKQRSLQLRGLPYGIILSVPLIFYGIRRLLWNIMSSYELNSTEIRLLTGSLIRKERFFEISEFYDISFRQNLLETPFGIGCIILAPRAKGRKLRIKGVFEVRSVVKALRSGLVSYDR